MIPRSHRIGSRYLPPLLMDVASQFGENAAGAFNISEGGEQFGVRNHVQAPKCARFAVAIHAMYI